MFFDTNLRGRESERKFGAQLRSRLTFLKQCRTRSWMEKVTTRKYRMEKAQCATSGSFEQLVGNLFLSIDDVSLLEFFFVRSG